MRLLSAHCLLFAICALLGWSVWARGGTVVALQGPMPWMGLAILLSLALDRWRYGSQKSEIRSQKSEIGCQASEIGDQDCPPSTVHCPLPSDLRPLTSDLLFWAGLAFLVLLTIQWWNAGRHPYFHPFEHRWVFMPPPHPGWPSAVERGEAAEMLRWFFPAWALMLALRHARQPAWLARCITWFLVINAGLLGAFGVAQMLSGTENIFWMTPMKGHFFASFGYENHAASYFALLFALSAGVLLQRLNAGQKAEGRGRRSEVRASVGGGRWAVGGEPTYRRTDLPMNRRAPIVIASMCAVLCLAGMVLSFSRAGMAMSVAIGGLAVFLCARVLWGRASLAQRVTAGVAGGMLALTLFFVLASMGGADLLTHLSSRGPAGEDIRNNLDIRHFLADAAWKTFAGSPWFGVGGWGYRHFVPLHAGAEGRVLRVGTANTHNDTMQFLCEFGAVGFGLMTVAVVAYAWPLARRVARGLPPGPAMAFAGLPAVLLHSTIDLPFRSPGVLYAWLAVCGVAAHGWTERVRGDRPEGPAGSPQ